MNVGFEVFTAVLLRIVACDTWYFLVAQVVRDFSRDRGAFIFSPPKYREIPAQRHNIKFEKTGIFTVYEL